MPDFAVRAAVHCSEGKWNWSVELPTFYLHNVTKEDAKVKAKTILQAYWGTRNGVTRTVQIDFEEV